MDCQDMVLQIFFLSRCEGTLVTVEPHTLVCSFLMALYMIRRSKLFPTNFTRKLRPNNPQMNFFDMFFQAPDILVGLGTLITGESPALVSSPDMRCE